MLFTVSRYQGAGALKPSVLVINGQGLDDLSDYDGNSFSGLTLAMIRDASVALCEELGTRLDFRQTEDHDKMFQWIARESEQFDGIIINPGGYSRSATVSNGVYRSALQNVARMKKPVIEVHINNIYREGAEVARPLHEPEGDMGFICGFGLDGYLAAIRAIKMRLESRDAA
jgi:3-dehydroquinate dehydratase-2